MTCAPLQEIPCVLGDMSDMHTTVEKARARPDSEKWREELEVELGAMHSMTAGQVVAQAVGCRMLFDIKQLSARYQCSTGSGTLASAPGKTGNLCSRGSNADPACVLGNV